jgi:site-specific DNA recombinase
MPQATVVMRSDTEISPGTEATAVIYLRVSSPSQLTGYSPEGYSIEGQREACKRHAESLGARIIGEYIEPGKTAVNMRRPTLQRMLAELPDVRPTYVIFYDLSRVARDEFDAFWLLREIDASGSKLESTLERVDDTSTGMLMYGVMASLNAFRSRRDGEKVKLGLERKHADGGSHGPARIGYLNITEIAGYREVATIAVDEDRAPLVKLAFDLFATGEHTITTITELLEDIGLRTRGTPKRPSRPLSRSMIHRILKDDYYIGIVTRKGVKREGRHEAIIDHETFEQVQHILFAHRASGDRSHKHTHYLTRSVYCGVCHKRLGYGRHRGNGGVYEYFSCLSRMSERGRCTAPYFRVPAVERGIERKYKTLLLKPEEQTAIREALRSHVQTKAEVAHREVDRHVRRLRELTDEQQKLVQLFYKGGVYEEILQAEQRRIESERAAAERWTDAANREVADVDQALNDALALIDLATVPYLTGSPTERRLINLAIYLMLLISDPDHVQAKPTALFTQLVPMARKLAREAAQDAQKGPHDAHCPGTQPQNDQSPVFRGSGSQSLQMAEREGFEPSMEFDPHTRLAGECLQPLGHLSQDSGRPV